MNNRNKFDISKLKGKLSKVRDWMDAHHFPPVLLFSLLGIISTIWFLIRVIPKPSRAAYPCMQVAAPFMSGFVVYLLPAGGITIALRKIRHNIYLARYLAAGSFFIIAIVFVIISFIYNSPDSYANALSKTGPDDQPNQPMGQGMGVNAGRVIWVWDPKATNAACINTFDFYKPENTNQVVVNRMVGDAINKLSGKTNLNESWDALFHYFNLKKKNSDSGYQKGEKIFIKINQGTANGMLSDDEQRDGFHISKENSESQAAKKGFTGTCETYPNVVLEILHELVNIMGVDQKDISIGDPISHIYGHNYDIWAKEFPNVVYVDRQTSDFGRTKIRTTKKDLLFYSDKSQSDGLYDIIESADYMINVANLKPHGRAGISLTAKNHFGSQGRRSAFHLHHSLVCPISLGNPTNGGYHKYRVMVDLMGSKYLGNNTLLYVVDGLYGGGSNETRAPVKYFMPPFNNNWSNSIFISQDQVALESVCYDFLRTEWNGTYKHSSANNSYESMPNVNGVDDYLHQAADSSNWPSGITYDPDNSGKPLSSLGVHEHWNNADLKQYSRNLGKSTGIEIISIPDTLVGNQNIILSKKQQPESEVKNSLSAIKNKELKSTLSSEIADNVNVSTKYFNFSVLTKKFISASVDNNNTVWFLTESGIVNYDGKSWNLNNDKRLMDSPIKNIVCNLSDNELWMATSGGAIFAALPYVNGTPTSTYNTQNSSVLSNNILAIAMGNKSLQWFGSDKGISALRNKKWLANVYQSRYLDEQFGFFPIKAMATSIDGDSLYVATEGAGVTRVYRNDVDAVSGASEYAQWGPINLPSDNIYSICIAPDGTQWFGTDLGVARHIGYKTLTNWTVYNIGDGLIDNFVQSIAIDANKKLWFGTRSGVSVFDGTSWISFTENDGLSSNNVLCIAVDKGGIVWLGTDKGVTSYENGKFTHYK